MTGTLLEQATPIQVISDQQRNLVQNLITWLARHCGFILGTRRCSCRSSSSRCGLHVSQGDVQAELEQDGLVET